MKTKGFSPQMLAFTAVFTALIAAGAFIRIPVPVIPFTLQTMFVTMAGLLLGSRLGALSATIYMILGLIGVPIFTQGGGIGYVLQPSFGYIIGFIAGAFVSGFILEHSKKKSICSYILASFGGLGVTYIIGLVYLGRILNLYLGKNLDLWQILCTGFFFTIPGDSVLLVLGAFLSKRLAPIISKLQIQT